MRNLIQTRIFIACLTLLFNATISAQSFEFSDTSELITSAKLMGVDLNRLNAPHFQFIDVDNDNDLDVFYFYSFLAINDGFDSDGYRALVFQENVGTADNPNYGTPVNIYSDANPYNFLLGFAVLNFDNDADYDFIFSQIEIDSITFEASIRYNKFENTSNISTDFELAVVGQINLPPNYENSFSSNSYFSSRLAILQIADVNFDGKEELLFSYNLTEEDSTFFYYEQNDTDAAFPLDNNYKFLGNVGTSYINTSVGGGLILSEFEDVNQDGKLDVVYQQLMFDGFSELEAIELVYFPNTSFNSFALDTTPILIFTQPDSNRTNFDEFQSATFQVIDFNLDGELDIIEANNFLNQICGPCAFEYKTRTVFLYESISPISSISNNDKINYQVYPNPNDGSFKIELAQADARTYLIEVYNYSGVLLESIEISNSIIEFNKNLANGAYIIKVSNKNTFNVSSIIVGK